MRVREGERVRDNKNYADRGGERERGRGRCANRAGDKEGRPRVNGGEDGGGSEDRRTSTLSGLSKY